MMKKIIALTVLLLFLVNMFSVAILAEEATDSNSGPTTTEQDSETRIRVETEDGTKTELRERIRTRDGITEIKTEFMHVKEGFMTERTEFRSKIEDLKTACSADPKSEECIALREEARVEAKNFLLKSADTMIAFLEKRKAQIEASDLENKEALLVQINEAIKTIEEQKQKIEALGDDATREEIKAIAKELRLEWRSLKKELDLSRGSLMLHKFSGIIERADHLEIKLKRTLERLEAEGVDTTGIEELSASFNTHIDEARKLHKQAVEKFRLAKQSPDHDALVKEAHVLLVDAHKHLKLAHEDLKKIVMMLKETSDGEKELEKISQDIEIEAEVQKDGTTEVEVEIKGTKTEFTLETTDKEVIITEIIAKFSLTREQVEDNLKFETEDKTEETEVEDESEDDTEDDELPETNTGESQ